MGHARRLLHVHSPRDEPRRFFVCGRCLLQSRTVGARPAEHLPLGDLGRVGGPHGARARAGFVLRGGRPRPGGRDGRSREEARGVRARRFSRVPAPTRGISDSERRAAAVVARARQNGVVLAAFFSSPLLSRTWAFFVEFLASIRNLAIAAFYTRHILDRYPYYNLRESSQNKNNFNTEACGVLKFLNQSILNLFEELHSDAISNGLKVSAELKKQIELTDIEINKRLPRNILEDQIKDEEDRIVEVCHKIQHVFKLMQDANVHRITDLNELKLSVLQKFNEKLARMYKNLVHNIQSDYDTYVKNTKLEQEHKDLKVMRGYISMALHLLEISLWLAHFYERHEDDIRHGESKKRISLRVNKSILLEKIMNFGFVNSFYFVTEGNKLAIDIMDHFSKTLSVDLPIPIPLGFHARPATYVSIIARQYENMSLSIVINKKKFDAKSVMSLLQAGGLIADKGYETVCFEGDKKVIEDIKILAKHNYCEDNEIPFRLAYLRDFKN